ncbi:preprotein translocase subunit YajC [Malonomonas rubra]|uniref:preprotein translocase subunit YajC n=1 Tax=Malonomonas rubra TaxID=57040 RepID=UPI0026EFA28B|nr:preprotein translocase subunit YajC [Malonomonas rubra]
MATEAFAMAGNGAAQGQQGYEGLIMLVAMFAIFYFLLIRPQQKRAKQHKELVSNLKPGDQIVTAGGIHGKISSVEEATIVLEVATGVKMKMNRSAITEVKQ